MTNISRYSLMTAALLCALPGGFAADTLVMVANSGDSTVSIFTASQAGHGDPILRPLKVLPTGKSPSEICVSPDGNKAYVTNRAAASLTVLDLNAITVAATISKPAMKGPDGCMVAKDGKLYVAAAESDSVFVFSAAGQKLAEHRVGKEPRRLILSPDDSQLYVGNGEDRTVSILDLKTGKPAGMMKAGRDPRAMLFTADGKYIAVANVSDDTVQFTKPGETYPELVVGVPRSPQRLLEYPAKKLIFSVSRFDNTVLMLDMRPTGGYGRYLGSIPAGRGVWGLAFNPGCECLYTTNTADNTVSIIDLRLMRPGSGAATGKAPLGIAVR